MMTQTIRPLIRHVQEGNYEPISVILEHVTDVIQYWTKRYHYNFLYAFPDMDEANSIALDTAIQFIHTCDISQENTNLVKSLSRCIHNALELERKHRKDDHDFRVIYSNGEDGNMTDIIENLVEHYILKPEDHVLSDELKKQLEQNLRKLNEAERHIIHLRYHKELSFQEIATLKQLPVRTISSRLYRALEKLRRHMAA
jgi:RNA polymerase sigma factor (sigma-70 family)